MFARAAPHGCSSTRLPLDGARVARRARKLRRAVDAVGPLLAAAEEEVAYLEEVEVSAGGGCVDGWRGCVWVGGGGRGGVHVGGVGRG